MAKLVSFLLSSQLVNANIGPVTVQQLVNPLIAIRPKYIPSEYSFAITLGINDIDKGENTLRLLLTSPSGKDILDTNNMGLPVGPTDGILPDSLHGFVLTMPVQNVVIDEEGLYSLSVFFNDVAIATQSIPIYRQVDIK